MKYSGVSMRNSLLDVYRGVLILFVLLGHTANIPESLKVFIYSFHMPAFFILSGYLFNQSKPASLRLVNEIKTSFVRLIVPAWLMGLLCSIPFLFLYFNGGISSVTFLTKLYGTLTGYPNISMTFLSTPLWFLFVLFSVNLIAILGRRFFNRSFPFYLLFLGCAGLVLSVYVRGVVPFNFFVSLTCCLFFSFGLIIRRIKVEQKMVLTFDVFMVVIFIYYTMSYVPDRMDISQNIIGSDGRILINLIISIFGANTVFVFCKYLSFVRESNHIKWLDVNTLPIVGFDYYSNHFVLYVLDFFGADVHWVVIFILRVLFLSFFILFLARLFPRFSNLIQGKFFNQ